MGERLIRMETAPSFQPALKMRHLVLLVELGKHGSIMQAAKAVRLSQPAASKLLSELEQLLGVQLFERSARGVEPTSYGSILLRRAGAALAEMEGAHQEIREVMTGLQGHVRIGAILTPAVSLLPQAILLLQEANPAVRISVTVDASLRLLQGLLRDELDIVVGRGTLTKQLEQLHVEPLADEPHSVLARAGHPLLSEDPITLAGIARYGWIMPPPGSILRARLEALFLAGAVEAPRDVVETSDLPVVSTLLRNSNMLVALPPALLQPSLDTGALVVLPYELGIKMDSYGIITRRGRELRPAAQALQTILRQQSAVGAGT